MDTKTLEYEALRLPLKDQAKLAQKLLLNLDAPPDPEIERAWLDEAESRARDIDEGRVQPVSAEEVRRKAQLLLR